MNNDTNELKVKFCGLKRIQDVEAANACQPDYVGFVFADSSRQITPEQAAALRRCLSPLIKAVGVFVNESAERMTKIAQAVKLDAVQLHGGENKDIVTHLRTLSPGVEIWRAVRLRSATDLLEAQQAGADLLLIDAFCPDAAGGTGKTADWGLLSEHRPDQKFFLAGGLNASNIEEAVMKTTPFGVDVSSGIETDGVKDNAKMHAMMQAIQTYRGGTANE